MDRDCNKCIHHTSGSCSAWECTGTKTVDDVRADALAEVEEAMYHQCFECDNDEDMQNSLRTKFNSMRYKGRIDEAEYQALIKKLDGHDLALLDKVSKKFHSRIMFRELTRAETMDIFDEVIAELKAEVKK